MTSDVLLADRLPEGGLHQADTALPPLAVHGNAGQLRAVEREVLVHEIRREERRGSVDDLEPQPRLPFGHSIEGQQRAEAGQEARLRHHHLAEDLPVPRCDPGQPRHQVDACGGGHLLPGQEVVRRHGVAAAHGVPVMAGQLRLQRHDPLRLPGGIGDAGQCQHPLDVPAEGGAGRVECVQPVVRLIGERDPALHEEGHVARGVPRIRFDVELHHAPGTLTVQRARRAQQRRHGIDVLDRGELLRQGCGADLLDARDIHEAREQVTDLAGFGTLWRSLRVVDDLLHVTLGLLGEHVERAPPGLVVRDAGAFHPGAVDVAVQIVLGPDPAAELVDGKTAGKGRRHGVQTMPHCLGPRGRRPVRIRLTPSDGTTRT